MSFKIVATVEMVEGYPAYGLCSIETTIPSDTYFIAGVQVTKERLVQDMVKRGNMCLTTASQLLEHIPWLGCEEDSAA